MGSKNVYATVKSYSKRGRLLKKADFQTLAESRDLDELMTRIKNTIYGESVSDVQQPYTSQKIENALRGHLADVHYSIAKMSRDKTIFNAYYMKFIISNLKSVLKGKVLGKTQEEIEAHINLRAEELIKQRDVVIKALVSKDLEEAVASLSSGQFGEEISKAATLYNEKKNLQVFDLYFDKILYQQLGQAIRNSKENEVTKLIGMDIDFYNLLSAIRGKFWDLEEDQIQDLIVSPTPSASRELIGRMISSASVKNALSELSNTRYKNLIPESENELDAVAEFERKFELEIYQTALRSFTKMFNFVTIIGITKLTAYEVRNLAAIAYAVEQKIPTETTMSKLILEED